MAPAALIARLIFWLWFGGAVAAGHFLILQRLPFWGSVGLILAVTGAPLVVYFRSPAARAWLDSLGFPALVLPHLVRFVGVYFLMLEQRGVLPRAFAVPSGLGEIVVATMALPVLFAPLGTGLRLRALFIWNVVATIDLLMVVVIALQMALTSPAQLRPLTQLPLSLLATLIGPLLAATHVLIFIRLLRGNTRLERRPGR